MFSLENEYPNHDKTRSVTAIEKAHVRSVVKSLPLPISGSVGITWYRQREALSPQAQGIPPKTCLTSLAIFPSPVLSAVPISFRVGLQLSADAPTKNDMGTRCTSESRSGPHAPRATAAAGLLTVCALALAQCQARAGRATRLSPGPLVRPHSCSVGYSLDTPRNCHLIQPR